MASPAVWIGTLILIAALLLYDFFFHVRQAHAPTLPEAARWSAAYVGIALVFGAFVWWLGGPERGAEYFAGYTTEKALSVDNLFVFVIILAAFKVPRDAQQKVILFGIAFALVARTAFIFLGAALINSFAWVFYLFGIVLLMTAGHLLRDSHDTDDDISSSFMVRLMQRLVRTTPHYDADRVRTTVNGVPMFTPLALVMGVVAGTDLLFAIDSIPAIYGLTNDVFIVFTATAFSLLGLRQLFFLIDGLLDRLIYLKYGLALILAWIGVKLILHALHENTLPFINDGQPVHIVEISTGLSLAVIIGVLIVTVTASLLSPAGRAISLRHAVVRDAQHYLDATYESTPDARAAHYADMVEQLRAYDALPEHRRGTAREQRDLREVVAQAEAEHQRHM